MSRMFKFVSVVALLMLSVAVGSCGRGGHSTAADEADTLVSYARYLSIVDRGDYAEVTVRDPWNVGAALGRYALVERGADVDVPQGLTAIIVPLERSVVYSSVHTSAVAELGALSRIAGVADAAYFTAADTVSAELAAGRIADVGSSMSPSVEKIIDLQADALLLSPWENGNLGGVERAGVPLLMMADYLEPSPLGRAEWIKLIGRLYGRSEEADSIFTSVCFYYDALKAAAANSGQSNPKVFTEKPYNGVWYVPGGESYMATMLADAGAEYPWRGDSSSGSLALDEAAVIDRAADAEFWLIKDDFDHTPQSLLAAMPHAKAFAAYPCGVYVCNTATSPIFRDIAFHPDRILADFVNIFHPNCISNTQLYYFHPITR